MQNTAGGVKTQTKKTENLHQMLQIVFLFFLISYIWQVELSTWENEGCHLANKLIIPVKAGEIIHGN